MAFIDRAVEGLYGEEADSLNEALEKAIEVWYAFPEQLPMRVSTYLGMTPEEYRSWVLNPAAIVGIIDNRRRGESP